MARHQIAPAWQTQRGPLVQAHGCAAGVPVAGAKVFGETRQNLWVNPVGTIGGVTATETDDGALQVSGTASSYALIGVVTYALLAGKTYRLITDKSPTTGAGFRVRLYLGDTWVRDIANTITSGNDITFTIPSSDGTWNSVRFALTVNSGATVSGTYRVMLNEGSEPEPWCPPGLSSVSELETVTAGKNLLKINSDLQTKTVNGVTFTPNEDGTVTVNGTSTDTSDYYLLGTSWATRADNYLPGQEMVFP